MLHLSISAVMLLSLAMLGQNSACAEVDNDIGRLFYSPESREALEAKRGLQPKPKLKKRAYKPIKRRVVVKAKPSLPLPDPIMLQGYVKRSDGPNTVWINHEVVTENTQTQNVKIGRLVKNRQSKKHSLLAEQNNLQKSEQLIISVPANGKVIQLKPGQTYTPQDNRIDDITTMSSQ